MIKGNNILLRALEPADLPNLVEWENNPENWKVSERLHPYNLADLKSYLENAQQDILQSGQFRWGIEDLSSGSLIGAIDLYDFNALHQRVGVGIIVDKEFRKKGYAKEALTLLVNYAFNHLMVHQVYALITADNQRSIDLFQKNGFVQTGTLKDWYREKDQFLDVLNFQILL